MFSLDIFPRKDNTGFNVGTSLPHLENFRVQGSQFQITDSLAGDFADHFEIAEALLETVQLFARLDSG
jgi:hypothetical protein